MPRATTAACEVMPPRAVRMPGGRLHAVDVLGRGLDAHEDDALALLRRASASSALNTTLPTAAPGEAGRPARDDVARRRLRIERRVQQLVELVGLDAQDRFFLGDQPSFTMSTAMRTMAVAGALAVAGLQHPELALLDGELDVLHVAVVLSSFCRRGRARRRPPA